MSENGTKSIKVLNKRKRCDGCLKLQKSKLMNIKKSKKR